MKKTVGPAVLLAAVLAAVSVSLVFSFPDVDGSTQDGKPHAEENSSQILNESTETEDAGKNQTGDDTMSSTADATIRLTFDDEEVIVKMDDNPTGRDFLALLPLTLTFKDYSGTEKISYLPRRLSTEDAPEGSDPSVGDLTYYSPWGNLAIFYKDFGYAEGLIKLGTIESGTDKLGAINGDFTVTIERIES